MRFTAPVRSGRKVRGVFTIVDTVERDHNHFQQTLDIVVEREGEDRPAMIARWLIHFTIAEGA